ncbi:MAG: hypothetical protein FWE90_11825 [Defluviitaleaceae bacterium]|nr:hypothetical protein [Defluviitaleaceae bacterium]
MIFYYTRTQKTKIAAEALHDITGLPLYALSSDIHEVKGIRFAWRAVRSIIGTKGYPVSNMPVSVPDEIYLCGPIWVGEPAGPLKYFVRNVDLSGKTVNLLLTGMQPTEENRESARKCLVKAGCQPGGIYMIATQKELPEKEIVTEHLREMLEETNA